MEIKELFEKEISIIDAGIIRYTEKEVVEYFEIIRRSRNETV